MREDMGKIVIDAYRWGAYGDPHFSYKKNKHKKRDDDRPSKESMSRRRYGNKHLGDNLSPLYRWLDKQVNRRWDDVYSEVVAALKGGFTNMDHIKQHVMQRVELHTKDIDGWPHYMPSYWSGGWTPVSRDDLYVDEKGFLRKLTKRGKSPAERAREQRNRAMDIKMLDALTVAVKIDGTWFAADLKPTPMVDVKVFDYSRMSHDPMKAVYKTVKRPKDVYDAFAGFIGKKLYKGKKYVLSYDVNVPYRAQNLYAESVRTMSKKEIAQRIPENER